MHNTLNLQQIYVGMVIFYYFIEIAWKFHFARSQIKIIFIGICKWNV